MIVYIMSYTSGTGKTLYINKKITLPESHNIINIQVLKVKIPIKYKHLKQQLEDHGEVFIYGYEFKDILNGSYA